MKNTLFITVAGGLIQNVDVTDDLANIKVIVIDFDVDGVEHCTQIDGDDCVIFKYPTVIIKDGEKFRNIVRRIK